MIAQIAFPKRDQAKIIELAKKAFQKEEEGNPASYIPIPLRMRTRLDLQIVIIITDYYFVQEQNASFRSSNYI